MREAIGDWVAAALISEVPVELVSGRRYWVNAESAVVTDARVGSAPAEVMGTVLAAVRATDSPVV